MRRLKETKRQSGQSLVETALAMPVLVLVAAVVMELARLFALAAVVQVAAHQAARSFAVNKPARQWLGDPTKPEEIARSTAGQIISAVRADPRDVSTEIQQVSNGESARVTVTYFVPAWFPFLGRLVGQPRADGRYAIPVSARAFTRIEWGASNGG